MTHLWEVNHPYYCSETNYYSNEQTTRYESWNEFIEEEGHSDLDMNLLFRWDWRKADPEEEHFGNQKDQLSLYIIGQRKGLFRSVEIDILDENEPAVIEWLKPRLKRLMQLWEPLTL